jgi:hypothetical protein
MSTKHYCKDECQVCKTQEDFESTDTLDEMINTLYQAGKALAENQVIVSEKIQSLSKELSDEYEKLAWTDFEDHLNNSCDKQCHICKSFAIVESLENEIVGLRQIFNR